MKYIVYDPDNCDPKFLKASDVREEAQAFIDKIGFGVIKEVDDIIDLDRIIYYYGSYQMSLMGDLTGKLHLGGHEEPFDDLRIDEVSYNRNDNNLYFQIIAIPARSIKEARGIVMQRVDAIVKREQINA